MAKLNELVVNAGGAGEITVDPNKFSGAVMEYVLTRGLKEMLTDAHASATAELHGDKVAEAKRGMAEKKLASLYAGEVAAARGGGGRVTDPVAAEMVRLYEPLVEAVIRKAGKKLGDYKAAKTATTGRGTRFDELVRDMVAQDPRKLRETAIANVAARKEDAAELDLGALDL